VPWVGSPRLRRNARESRPDAAVRWNKKQALKPNDLFDFDHAAAAIGYCDAFFTDGPLRAMLSRHDLGLKEDFGCLVSSEIGECMHYLATVH